MEMERERWKGVSSVILVGLDRDTWHSEGFTLTVDRFPLLSSGI
jgi:hypothetical protein